MAETAVDAPQTVDQAAPKGGIWSVLSFWGLHGWILAYCFVMGSAFFIQFVEGEFPCPLCMLQRYGMILSTLAALYVIMQARRGTLTTARYAQGLGMGLLAVIAGSSVSVRQILLHIKPGDEGYGDPVLGLHLYTWALITFVIVMVYVAVMLMLAPRGIPVAPPEGSAAHTLSTVVIWAFIGIIAANVVAIIFLEGFAMVLPDDPVGYNLIDQFSGR